MTKLPEEWRSVPSYEGYYEVSSLGRVRSVDRVISTRAAAAHPLKGCLRRHCLDRNGYPHLGLSKGHVRKNHKVHALVAEAFIGPRPDGHDVNHKNGIRTDNRASNLEYATRSENMKNAQSRGTLRLPGLRGEDIPQAKLTEEQVRYIRAMRGRKTQRKLAAELGCSQGVVGRVSLRQTWRHVD